jgi:hypothetical protein
MCNSQNRRLDFKETHPTWIRPKRQDFQVVKDEAVHYRLLEPGGIIEMLGPIQGECVSISVRKAIDQLSLPNDATNLAGGTLQLGGHQAPGFGSGVRDSGSVDEN